MKKEWILDNKEMEGMKDGKKRERWNKEMRGGMEEEMAVINKETKFGNKDGKEREEEN